MNDLMAVLLNGIAQIEYDRRKPLPGPQDAYLDRMDARMDEGIEVDGSVIGQPDTMEKARFVASNLAHAIKTDDEELAAAMTTYLAVRLPDLKQVKLQERESEISIEFVYDEDYIKQFPVQFDALKGKGHPPDG